MRLTRNSIQRIGAAVRAVESGKRDARNGGADAPGATVRMALVGDTIDDSPDPGDPYIYEVGIYTGCWDDAGAARDAIVEEVEVWSTTALTAGDWVGVVRCGNHWEVIGTPINLHGSLRYETTSHQLQVLVGGTWTLMTGGQAVS